MIICKICNPNNPEANGYCAEHSSGGSAYIPHIKNQDPTSKFFEKIVDNMSEELRIAMIAGCELEHGYDNLMGVYKIRTKYPIAIHKSDGRIFVYEDRGSLSLELKRVLE